MLRARIAIDGFQVSPPGDFDWNPGGWEGPGERIPGPIGFWMKGAGSSMAFWVFP
jgi:hypothetical protein